MAYLSGNPTYNEAEDSKGEKGTVIEGAGGLQNIKGGKVCVKVYFNEQSFAEIVALAEKSGIRHRGLKLYTKKANGFADEVLANTDKIAKFLKFTAQYWNEHEAERFAKLAELAEQERKIAAEKARLIK